MKPGGIFVVNDFVPNEERTEPTFALRFSVYTLTHTPEGECWTLSQYSDWLKKAGFGADRNARRYSQDAPGNDADYGDEVAPRFTAAALPAKTAGHRLSRGGRSLI